MMKKSIFSFALLMGTMSMNAQMHVNFQKALL